MLKLFTGKEMALAALVLILFILVSVWAETYSRPLISLMERSGKTEAAIFYVLGAAAATILAPFSFLPFLPVAAAIFGSFFTALLSILGWTSGAAIAFVLARRYGHPFVHRLFSLERLKRIEKYLPAQSLFWSVVFLRMALPVDILSYAIALFTEMSFTSYLLATVIGITPFAFVFAYLAAVPLWAQLLALAGAVIIVVAG